MNNEELKNLSDKEKLLIFNISVNQAIENNKPFESMIGSVINAFSLTKQEMKMAPREEFQKKEPFDMNMVPKEEFASSPFDFNMRPKDENAEKDSFWMNMKPKEEITKEDSFWMNMAPKKDSGDFKGSGDYDGPVLEPVDTQKVEIENQISF